MIQQDQIQNLLIEFSNRWRFIVLLNVENMLLAFIDWLLDKRIYNLVFLSLILSHEFNNLKVVFVRVEFNEIGFLFVPCHCLYRNNIFDFFDLIVFFLLQGIVDLYVVPLLLNNELKPVNSRPTKIRLECVNLFATRHHLDKSLD